MLRRDKYGRFLKVGITEAEIKLSEEQYVSPNLGRVLSVEEKNKLRDISKLAYGKLRKGKYGRFIKECATDAEILDRDNRAIPSMLGKTHSEETKKKISLSRIGVPMSEETKKKMSDALSGEKHPGYGKKRSDAVKLKISETKKRKFASGETTPFFKGKKRSDGVKLKISETKKKQYASGECVAWMKGRKHSEEFKRHLSEIATGRVNLKMRGENHPMWKGGVSKLQICIRTSGKFIRWRESVYKRDNWTCQNCYRRGSIKLNCHHMKPFAQILFDNNISSLEDSYIVDELWDTNNGVTLCLPCHKERHRLYGKPQQKTFESVGEV